MSARHASDADDVGQNSVQTRPFKRARTYRACDQCITSKTRCDDHTALGCGRCIKLSKDCSLRHAPLGTDMSTPMEMMSQAGMAGMEARVRQLESALLSRQTTRTISSGSHDGFDPSLTHSPSEGQEYGLPRGHAFASMIDADDSYRWVFNERLSAVVNKKELPCVMGQGHVTRAEFGAIYHRWKHDIASMIPLPSLLSASSPAPTHPSVIAAIIAQSDHTAAHLAASHVTEGIHRILAGDVSLDAVMSLLVLALDKPSTITPSSTRLIALAYDIGKALGMEAKTRNAVELGQDLAEPHWASLLHDAMLWETVKVYYNLIHLCYTPLDSLIPSQIMSLPKLEGHHSRVGVAFLRDLYFITTATADFLVDLSAAEATAHMAMPSLPPLLFAWDSLQQNVDRLRATLPPTSALWLTTVEHSTCYRTVKYLQSLPLVLHPDHVLPHLNTWGSQLCRVSTKVLISYLEWPDDAFFPSIPYSSIVTSVAVILTVHATIFRFDPHYLEANLDLAHRAETKLLATGDLPAAAIRRVRAEFVGKWGQADRWGACGPASQHTAVHPAVATLVGTDVDGSEMDLSAWSWLFEQHLG